MCPHKPLQPPFEVHLEEDAYHRACHPPAHVAIRWKQQVEADLLADEKLGVFIWYSCNPVSRYGGY